MSLGRSWPLPLRPQPGPDVPGPRVPKSWTPSSLDPALLPRAQPCWTGGRGRKGARDAGNCRAGGQAGDLGRGERRARAPAPPLRLQRSPRETKGVGSPGVTFLQAWKGCKAESGGAAEAIWRLPPPRLSELCALSRGPLPRGPERVPSGERAARRGEERRGVQRRGTLVSPQARGEAERRKKGERKDRRTYLIRGRGEH